MDISGLYTWFSGQVVWALYIVLLVLLIVTAFKRAWIAMIGVILGMAVIGMLVVNPEIIKALATWLAEKISLGE